MAPKKPTGMSESDIKSINSVASSINKMNTDTRRSISGSAAKISSMGSSYKYIDKAGYTDRSVKEVSSSVVKILNKFSTTIETLSKGVLNITAATATSTKNAISQYGRAVSQDVSFNKQNAVAMALSQSTPIFGYFAAKFMETDVFKDAIGRMKDNIGKALAGIGNYIRYGWERFKSAITFEEYRAKRRRKKSGGGDGGDEYFDSPKNASYRATKNIPKLQHGGLVSKSGIVYVHSGEVVAPINKIFKKSKYSSEQLLNSKVSLDKQGWLSKIYGTLLGLKIGMTGLGLDLKSHILSMIVKNPFLRKMAMGLNVMNSAFIKIPKFLFKVRTKYNRELPASTNVQENMANILGITYVRSMERYDQMIFYLRRLSEKITGVDVAPPGNPTYTNYQRIKNVASALHLGGMFDMFANMFRRNKRGNQLSGGGHIDAEYTNLNPNQKLLGYTGGTPKGSIFGRIKNSAGNIFSSGRERISQFRDNKESIIERRLKSIQEATEGTKEGIKSVTKKGKGILSTIGTLLMGVYSTFHSFLRSIPLIGKPLSWLLSAFKFIKWDIPAKIFNLAWKGGKFAAAGLWGGTKLLGKGAAGGARGLGGLLKLATKGGGLAAWGAIDTVIDAFKGAKNADKMFGGNASGMQKGFAGVGGLLGGEDQGQSKGGMAGVWGSLKGALFGAVRGATLGMMIPPWGVPIGAVLGGIFGAIGPERIAKALNSSWEGMKNVFGSIANFVQHPIDNLENMGEKAWSYIKNNPGKSTAMIAGAGIGFAFGGPAGLIAGALIGWGGGRFTELLSGLWDKLVDVKDKYIDPVAGDVKRTVSSVATTIGKGYDKVKEFITGASDATGVSATTLARVANVESNFNPNARNKSSSAAGLFQFTDETWRGLVQKYGSKYGVSTATSKMDPRANSLMGALFTRDNQDFMKSRGIPINDSNTYLAHFLGPHGLAKLYKSNDNVSAASILPRAAASNSSIFYKNGKASTVGDIKQWAAGKMNSDFDPGQVTTKKEIAQIQTDQQMNQINATNAANKKLQDSTAGKFGEIGKNIGSVVSNAITSMTTTNTSNTSNGQTNTAAPFDQELSNVLAGNMS